MVERTSRVTSRTIRQALEIRSIIEAGSYRTRVGALVEIAEAILRMIDGSQVVDSSTADMASDAVTLPIRRKVEITQEDSVDAVFRLASTGSRVGLLNFASGLHRGGGFDLGASAQEEALCRASTLIAALESTRADLFYERNALAEPLFTDTLIFSPGVPFIRRDGELVADPVLADVFTLAAPRADAAWSRGMAIPATLLYDRLSGLLAATQMRSLDHLILGAWGCGAYANDSRAVARAFRSALESSVDAPPSVTFAVLDRSSEREIIGAFEEEFLENGKGTAGSGPPCG